MSAAVVRAQRHGAATELGRAQAAAARGGGHDAPLPAADLLCAATGQRQWRRPRVAVVRRVPRRTRTRGHEHRGRDRRHVENYKPWLARRPGQNKPRVTPATIAHRLGTLRMFFVRIDEWGWDDAPPRVPMFNGDLPRQDHALPKAFDDAAAAKLLRTAANAQPAAGPGHRRGVAAHRFAGWRVHDASLRRGGPHRRRPWLHVPVGKLHDDRYLPLHPHLVTLIDDYRTDHVRTTIRCCYRGRTAPHWIGTPSPGTSTRSPPRPGCRTSIRTSCGTPWPPKPSTAA